MRYKYLIRYALVISVFVVSSVVYFYPVLQSKQIKQSDITQFIGMSKEIKDFRDAKKEEPYWTGSAFSGMPAYQLSAYYPNNFIAKIDKVLLFLPRPADQLFLYFIGFFVLLIALKTDWKLATLGALSFGFSTYLIILFGVGHNAKAHAIAYMPMVLAGILWIFQKRYFLGFIFTCLAMSLEINANHPQMTYYLGLLVLILTIIELIIAFRNRAISVFVKQSFIILTAIFLAVGMNSTRLLSMREYASFSTRGKSELTINPDGTKKIASTGLSKDYITEYSYGIAETFNLLIPRFTGGGTVENLGEDSHFYNFLKTKIEPKVAREYSKQVFTYWGNQPIVEAPAYIGAVIFFLFFIGVFLIKSRLKYWLLAGTIFSILMSWGKNFPLLTNFFIDYIPLYNKFRAVSSIQVIAELCVPLLGILALKDVFSSKIPFEQKQQAIKKAFYIVGGIALFFTVFGSSMFAFQGIRDGQYSQLPGLIDALISDRKSLLFYDSLRSFILVSLCFISFWFLINKKVSQNITILILGILILFDLISVDKRYVNSDNFTSLKNIQKPFTASLIDKQILRDTTHYRVGNFATNPMQDGRTSYFHKSIGGYHAAKLGRYQELFDFQIAKNNSETLNMLNTKYLILSDEKGREQIRKNTNANGNAWFVSKLKVVNSADEEIMALDSLSTKIEAVIRSEDYKKYFDYQQITEQTDSTATIKLTKYDLTELSYRYKSNTNQVTVFSEIYYKDGWNAYIDGKLSPHFRADYVLRAMRLPAGNHKIEFKFEPTVIKKGNVITLTCYVLFLCFVLGWFFVIINYKRN